MIRLIAAFTAFGFCALANAKAPPQLATLEATAASFATLDRNADHRLSRTEAGFDRKLSEVFAYVDINGDGFISRDEYLAANQKSPDAG
jgi:hypothetical protein